MFPAGKSQVACSLVAALTYLTGDCADVNIVADETGLFDMICLEGCNAESAIQRLRGALLTPKYFAESQSVTRPD